MLAVNTLPGLTDAGLADEHMNDSRRMMRAMLVPHTAAEGATARAAIMMEADADSISAALRRLFSMSDHEREMIGMNGRCLVEDRFQWLRIGRQMMDVYDWILGLGDRPDCVMN